MLYTICYNQKMLTLIMTQDSLHCVPNKTNVNLGQTEKVFVTRVCN